MPRSPVTGDDVVARTIPEMLRDSATSWPDAPAVEFPEFSWTFGQLAVEAETTARGLIALGVRPGDHVAILVPNGADFLRAFFGVSMAGAVAVTLNTRYRRADLEFVLSHCDATSLIMSRQLHDHFDFEQLTNDLFAEKPDLRPKNLVVLDCDEATNAVSGRELFRLADQVPQESVVRASDERHPTDNAAMLYTSGTTALPKGCLLTHHALTRSTFEWGRATALGPCKSIWIPNPLFHIGALSSLLASLQAGSLFLSQPYFEVNEAVRLLSRHAVSAFFPVFDAVALPILDHPDFAKVRFDKVEHSFVTGNPNNVDRVKRVLPTARHLNVYGMTETSGWCCLNFDDDQGLGPLPGGFPLPGVELRIYDAVQGRAAQVGEAGFIHVRSYCTIQGYYKEDRRKSFDAEGWFDTGDLGVLKPDGSIRFQGRAGDFIKVGGENVSPAEVELFLARHPAVRLVSVVGVSDRRLGMVPAAFVETYPHESCTEQELLQLCSENLARFKVPRYFRFIVDGGWPMSATKIRKGDLRASLEAELSRDGTRGDR